MRKIAIVTGTRAEFGLLKPLLDSVIQHEQLTLQLIVTAMHLSPEFGYTIKEIENSGYTVNRKIECLLSSDSATGVTKSIGLAMIGFADAFEELDPDVCVILGDRSEMLAAASAAMIANIPIAHIHGGETTEGAYDEAIRHAITKMSFWHFTSTEIYRKRVIQLGENPDRVFNVGAIGLDSINNLKLVTKKDLEKSIDFELGETNFMVTFHPATLEENTSEENFQEILGVLRKQDENTHFIFTYANSDKNGRIINKMIEEFVDDHRERSIAFRSMGQLRYLSALKFMDAVIGNSSSGIIEVPYFNIPTINIGDRQQGRVSSKSVIDVEPEANAISSALQKALSPAFISEIKKQEQLYGSGDTTGKIMEVLSNRPLNSLKKNFYDIKF